MEQADLFAFDQPVSRDSEKSQISQYAPGEDPDYLRRQLITYIGNKRRLLNLIGSGFRYVLNDSNSERLRVLDLFAGSGVVSRFAKQYASHLHANDLERYSHVINTAALRNASGVDVARVQNDIHTLNREAERALRSGFITELYATQDEFSIEPDDRLFYTRRNAQFLDTVRTLIDGLSGDSRLFALASLIQKASVHANTSGVFKGFYKDARGIGKFGGSRGDALSRICQPITLEAPILSRFECDHTITTAAAEDIVDQLDEFDVAYIDPPYNQHPYGSNYFMLNLLCDYERPQEVSRVSGIPKSWKRSRFNKRPLSQLTLFSVIERCPARYILLSYNCEGFVPIAELIEFLNRIGTVSVFDQRYNTFRGCRNLSGRDPHVTEYLFVLKRD
jgi:adenine-specific DNA-methyltransferase